MGLTLLIYSLYCGVLELNSQSLRYACINSYPITLLNTLLSLNAVSWFSLIFQSNIYIPYT